MEPNDNDDHDLMLELFGPQTPEAPSSSDSDQDEAMSLSDAAERTRTRTRPVATRVPGLVLWKQALQQRELDSILAHVEDAAWFDPSQGRNQAMRFGVLPGFLGPIVGLGREILPPELSARVPLFDQMIANYYAPGEGLTAHVDLVNRFDDGIVVASICGTCTMVFAPCSPVPDPSGPSMLPSSMQPLSVFLEPGDVVGISGAARWDWTHAIPAQAVDLWEGREWPRSRRISITLRRMLPMHDEDGVC